MSTPGAQRGTAWTARRLLTVPVPDCRLLTLSPDGSGLVLLDGTAVRRVDDRARPLWEVPWSGPAPDRGATAAAWTPEGDRLFLLGGGRLLSLDADTGTLLPLPPALLDTASATALAVSGDGRTLAVGHRSGDVLVWDLGTGETVELYGLDPVVAVHWRPRTTQLYVATPSSVQLWEPLDQTMSGTVGPRHHGLGRLACAPDDRYLAVEEQGRVVLVDPVTHAELAGRPLDRRCGALAFTDDGTLLALAAPGERLRLFDSHLEPRGSVPGDVQGPAELSLSATGLIAARLDDGAVAVWEPPDAAPRRRHHLARRSAVRRWANAMGATVGKVSATVDRSRLLVRPLHVPGAGDGCATPVLAWSPAGDTCWYESGPGTLSEFRPGDGTVLRTVALPGPATGWSDAEALGPDSLLLAPPGRGGRQQLLDLTTGEAVAELPGGPAVAADPTGALRWATPESGRRPRELLVHDLTAGEPHTRRLPVDGGVGRPAWSPDGRRLAAGADGRVLVWERTGSGGWQRVKVLAWPTGPVAVGRVAWSPDGLRLAAAPGSGQGPVAVWNTADWALTGTFGVAGGPEWAPALSWYTDSRLLAFPSAEQDAAIEIWDARTGRHVRTLLPPEGVGSHVWTVRWSPTGDRLATGHHSGAVVLWEIADERPGEPDGEPLPHSEDRLARLGAAAGRLATGTPLSLLSELLTLVGGAEPPPGLLPLAGLRGLQSLRELGWPPAALPGLVLLLVSGLPPAAAYLAPTDAGPAELSAALGRALVGATVQPRPPAPPLTELTAAVQAVDERLLGLLRILGPEAVAADPTLPVRVRDFRMTLIPPGPTQRVLLGLRLLEGERGPATGRGPTGRSGLARHGAPSRLLPTQLALPEELLRLRHSRSELLFRTSHGLIPPDPRGVVLVLDDTPATHGAIGSVLRLSAHLLATAALRRGRPCALVRMATPWQHRTLARPEDLVHLWESGPLATAQPEASLHTAAAAAGQLATGLGGAPRTIVLTHPYLVFPPRPGLRELRVHYPGLPVRDTAWLRWTLPPDPTPAQLRDVLTELLVEP
ncbi:WD40 repeat domain-containing protein [Kitasatospora sp. NPDC127111]|uniref:WD40 repeat domain-containing protein n=1 Tax=Kitasatospora sp. NPDC127111 TaxID=3345363 RepID=UPI003629B42A